MAADSITNTSQKFASIALFIWEYLRIGILKSLEYRVSTLSQVLGMIINDTLWVVFWAFYFNRFPLVQGWTLQDVISLWSTAALAFGLVTFFFANVRRVSQLVYTGQLDSYLTMPRNVLLHVSISSFDVISLGDIIFSLSAFLIFVELTPLKVVLFVLLTLLSACIMYGFFLTVHSLAFFMGNSENLAGQTEMFLIHFATYPQKIFDKYSRLFLTTILPAGLISSYPVEIMRSFSWQLLAQMVLGAVVFLSLGIFLFNLGLRRYESGNLMMMKG